jgi:uncharacterized protein with GYD domain
MPTYIVLYKFTDQGIKNVKSTLERAREAQEDSEKRGFKIIGVYWTQGQYDMVTVLEAPDEKAMAAGLLNVAGAGNVHSETMRAFTMEEMALVLQKV